MRALVIAMVLSLVVSGGAFADEKEDLGIEWDFQKVKVSEDECKVALFEGKILSRAQRMTVFVSTVITIAYDEHIFYIDYNKKYGMNCDKMELILDID